MGAGRSSYALEGSGAGFGAGYLIHSENTAERDVGVGNIRCKGCKELILAGQKKCPLCGVSTKRFNELTGILKFFGYMAAALAAISLLNSCLGLKGSSEPDAASNKCSQIMAHIMANEFVQKRLVSPSTAKFPKFSDPAVRIQEDPGCVFSVFGYVDSQNRFGAMIRTEFVAVVFREDKPGGNIWKARQIVLSE